TASVPARGAARRYEPWSPEAGERRRTSPTAPPWTGTRQTPVARRRPPAPATAHDAAPTPSQNCDGRGKLERRGLRVGPCFCQRAPIPARGIETGQENRAEKQTKPASR